MKFRNPFKSDIKHFISKEAENSLYEKAANDMDKNIIEKGIWTRAFAKAQGNKLKQEAFYIELIVENYKDSIRAGEELAYILASEEEKRQRNKYREMQANEVPTNDAVSNDSNGDLDKNDTKILILSLLITFAIAFLLIAIGSILDNS